MNPLNFQGLSIRRMISHSILERQLKDETSIADVTNNLLEFDLEMEKLIMNRLQAAMGRRGKGFFLQIADMSRDSFFGHCHEMNRVDDKEFIRRSQDIAHRLAGAQRRKNIKAGYLLVIEAQDVLNKKSPVYIAIKAEPQEALRRNGNVIEHVKELLMSPAQKFYKVGIIFKQDSPGAVYPNDTYAGWLFDEQFNSGNSGLSLYFYKEFLGFDYFHNGPIQTRNFYEQTNEFIHKEVKDDDKREELVEALRTLIKTDTADNLHPRDFANHYLETDEQKNRFEAVAKNFPDMVKKDSSLLDFSLKTRKLRFDDGIQISAPDEGFKEHVRVIKSQRELEDLNVKNSNYSIVVVSGKPSGVKREKANS